ncbi:MAG: phage/plasmid primase, P4 family [Veillonellaceae bacterium]|nr:phage/plasmid primase, P4 family [Veillonellaceae bacterium]
MQSYISKHLKFTLYLATCTGRAGNCRYPVERVIETPEELRAAVRFDHVGAAYRDHYRSGQNFLWSDVVIMDCDNDDSDDPATWMTAERLAAALSGIAFAAVPSRHHMQAKNGRAARPKYHVFFPIRRLEDRAAYEALKRAIHKIFPFFDANALDAARFLFGSTAASVLWQEGEVTIDEFVAAQAAAPVPNAAPVLPSASMPPAAPANAQNVPPAAGPQRPPMAAPAASDQPRSARPIPIPEGQRNSTLSRIAGRLVKRYGVTGEAQAAFYEAAARCVPPLGATELSAIWASAVRFGQKIAAEPGYVAPEAYAATHASAASAWGRRSAASAFRDTAAGAAPFAASASCDAAAGAAPSPAFDDALVPDDFSDVGEADTLARISGDELRYTDGTDFLRYNGVFWEETRQAGMAVHLDLLRRQLADARRRVSAAHAALADARCHGAPKADEAALKDACAEAEAYLSFIMKQRATNHIAGVLRAVRPMVGMDIADLDAAPFLLNTPTATYDLRRGMAGRRPHDPCDYLTKCTRVDPGDTGRAMWQDALRDVFCGDEALIAYAQRIAGLSLIGKVYVEAVIIAYGGGRNGKSTYWNAQAKVLGTYAGTISADALTARCPRNVKPEMAELKGRRLVIASETEEGMRFSTSVIKQLASTDPVAAEKKYKDPFHFEPTHTLVLYTNHLPRVGAMDEGIWRRLIVIPFGAVFEGEKDIRNYGAELAEKAGPAILAWMMEGARRVIAEHFVIEKPPVVRAAIQSYRDENNWLSHFLEECCETGGGYEARSGELLARYRSYCLQTGEYQRSTTDFYAAIERAGFVRKRRYDGRFVLGLRLKPSILGA